MSPKWGEPIYVTIGNPSAPCEYQWYREEIFSSEFLYETSSSYIPQAADIGCKLYCTVKGVGDFTGERRQTTIGKVTADKPILETPTISATPYGSDSISVKIGRIDKATGYKLEYSTTSGFKSSEIVTYTSSGTKKINVSSNTMCYLRVRGQPVQIVISLPTGDA